MEALEPPEYLGHGQLILVGLFVSSQERNYVLLLLDAPGVHPYGTVYHEYAHFVFSRTHRWMPVWLSEGIAEFYQNTEIVDGAVRLGKGDPYIQSVLDRNALMPLPTLLAVDQHSPYYHEEDKGSMFYAESWALTHYLKDKDDLDGTHRLSDYLDLLQTKNDPVSAAAQTFGDLTQLQQDLKKYILDGKYSITEMSGSTSVDDSSFVVQGLSQPQANTMRGDFLAHEGRLNDARSLLQSVLHDDPANVPAFEAMGYTAFIQHNYDESRKWCQQAIKLDAQSFAAHYCFAAASIRKGMPDKASLDGVEESLRTSIKLNPTFALAYDALAMFYAGGGKRLTEANELIQTAIQLEPGDPEVRVDEAQILAMMNRSKDAMDTLDLALKLAHTPEQTAAVENVLQSMKKFEAERSKLKNQNLAMRRVESNPNSSSTTAQKNSAVEKPPRAIYSPGVEYTEEARRAKLEGTCTVSLIVGVDGKPSNIIVTKKLGMGLDEKAVETVSKWKFEPGTRYGRPVPSRVNLSLGFQLYGKTTDKYFELSESAKAGDPAAEFELANAFFAGKDIPKDESQGMALLERAARSGLPQAQFQMGERTYGDGNNSENYVAAYMWYALAQRSGFEKSESRVTELEGRMTPNQLAEAHKRVLDTPQN
jgi:TonB family protein